MFKENMGFDEIKESDFEILPEGDYPAIVENIDRVKYAGGEKHIMTHCSEPEDSDDMIEITFQLLSTNHPGRKQFTRLYMWHTNEIAARIAKHRFKELAEACDKNPQMVNREELYDIPLIIRVKHSKKGDKTYVNVVKIIKQSGAAIDITPPARTKNVEDDIPF